MKKFLLVLSASLLLIGCNGNSSKQDEKKEDENNVVVPEDNGNNNVTPEPQPQPSVKSETKLVTFYDQNVFSGQLEYENVQNNFVSFVNGEDSILSSISFEGKAQIDNQDFSTFDAQGNQSKQPHRVFWMGSKSSTASLTMNFAVDVLSIKLHVQTYYTTYFKGKTDMTLYINVDSSSKLYVDEETNFVDLSVTDTSVVPEEKDFTTDYQTPTRQILIANKESANRVYIHSMEITYVVE